MESCLVVVDMQNDFVTGVLGTEEARAIVPKVVDFVASFKGDVLYTQDTHYDKRTLWDKDTSTYVGSYSETQEGKKLPVPHCIEGTNGWQVIPQLNPEHIIKKCSFGSLNIGDILKNYDEIHFIGVCTGICVISNAVIAKAANPEARIIIHKDLCACVTPESHETAIKAMELLQMDII